MPLVLPLSRLFLSLCAAVRYLHASWALGACVAQVHRRLRKVLLALSPLHFSGPAVCTEAELSTLFVAFYPGMNRFAAL